MTGGRLSTRSLAEGSLLAAVAVVLALAGIYLPFLGTLVVLAWPVPVMLAQLRQGMRLSILTVAVTGLLLASFLGPIPAAVLVLTLGPLGIALGESFRRGLTPWVTLLVGSAAALASLLVNFALVLFLLGQDLLEVYRTAFEESFRITGALYGRLGVDTGAILGPLQEQVGVLLSTLLPATLVGAGVMTAGLNYAVGALVLRRLAYRVEPFPAFANWQLPPYAPLAYIVGAGLVYLDGGRGTVLNAVGANISQVVLSMFLVSGLAVAYWWLSRYKLSRVFKVVLLIYVCVVQILWFVAVLLGMLDCLFDYRKLRRGEKKGEAGS